MNARLAGWRSTSTWKSAGLVAFPPAQLTEIRPSLAFAGTVVVMVVSDITLKFALTPLNRTASTLLKLLPVIVTPVPTFPLAGTKPLILGGGMIWKGALLVALPTGV